MRVLLDESLPRKLAQELAGHEVYTVQQRGWAGMKHGELLRRASAEFQVFVTGDQNIAYQQNVAAQALGVVILVANDNRVETLRPLVPKLLGVQTTIQPGELIRVTG